jgi:hypothetical protein
MESLRDRPRVIDACYFISDVDFRSTATLEPAGISPFSAPGAAGPALTVNAIIVGEMACTTPATRPILSAALPPANAPPWPTRRRRVALAGKSPAQRLSLSDRIAGVIGVGKVTQVLVVRMRRVNAARLLPATIRFAARH